MIYSMNIFTDTIFLLVYLMILFYFHIPDITNNNYLFHKLIIFISILAFRYIIEIIKKIKDRQKVDPFEVLNSSLYYALFGIIGYGVYMDLMYGNYSCGDISINIDSDYKRYGIAALIISLFIMFAQAGKLLFTM